jgi:hypothetical protein
LDLVTDIFLFLVSIYGIVLSIGVPGIALVLYIESKPDVKFEGKSGYIDYSSGLQIESYNAAVQLGKVPYLNRRVFRKIRLPPLRFVNLPTAQFDVRIETSLSNEKLGSDKWNSDYRRCCVCVGRSAIPSGVNNFMTHTSITQERSTTEIRRLVKEDGRLKLSGGTTNVVLTLTNNSELMIKDYEIQYTLPPIDKLELVSATRVDIRNKSIQLDDRDFEIRYDVPVKNAQSFAQIKKVQPIFLGTLDLEPGQTVVEFEYVQSQGQVTL